jgi:hypothetical protein
LEEDNGKVSHFGMYPSTDYNQARFTEVGQEQGYNGIGTDVREGVDAKKIPTSSLYSEISSEQVEKLKQNLEKPETYHPRDNNCAQWASRTYQDVTGKELSTQHTFEKTPLSRGGTGECPHGLEKSMQVELIKGSAQQGDLGQTAAASSSSDSDWKAKWRKHSEERRIPDPPPPPLAETESQSKGRSR